MTEEQQFKEMLDELKRGRFIMNIQKIRLEIKQKLNIERINAEQEVEMLINSLNNNPEFKKVYNLYVTTQIGYAKSLNENNKPNIDKVEKHLKDLLKQFNLNLSDLQPKYQCDNCRDTGAINGTICSCLQRRVNNRCSNLLSCQSHFYKFSDCDFKIMNELDKKVYGKLKSWCENYPNINIKNINILGKPGSGKTFFLECMANELRNKGIVVGYQTAIEINELARQYHIGNSFQFSDSINADILLIDDLGTEPMFNNITKEYFYNLINMRQVKNLPTIITSNLSFQDILNRYGERIVSRLANKSISLTISLTSEDKRLMEKKIGGSYG